ncbi:MAG: polyisoprenoid-binding protein [Alphaproteobacteria bacterium]|nr:MAG: polyisoprenoid-binding protein [Alphaproteobacteria bacterium]
MALIRLAALVAALVATPVLAADLYELDPAHSEVAFAVDRFGFNKVLGDFTDVTGRLLLDVDNPEASTIEARIGTASLDTGDAERDQHVAGPFWLKTEKFPEIRFRSTAVERTGENTARVTGDLSLLGATHPIAMEVTLNRMGTDPATKRQAVGFSATARLMRSAFGSRTALGMVGDEVTIRIEALAHKVEPAK